MRWDGQYAIRTLWTAHEGCWDVLLADWARLGLCVSSLIANFKVLYHHLTERPHPKFLIHWRRRISIYTHVTCGVGEMLFAVVAFGTCRPLFSLVACIFCIGHVCTSYYLMTGLFGIRNIMIPCYGFAVTVHAVNGVRLFLEPSSIPKMVDMFLTLQIYVWVRVMYGFIDTFATMARYQYTVSVIVAGMIIGPALSTAGGLMANLFLLAGIAAWNLIYRWLPPCCKHSYPGRTEDGDYKMDKVELSRSAIGADIHTYARLNSISMKTNMRRSSLFVCRQSTSRKRLTYFETVGEQSDHVNVHEEMPYRRISALPDRSPAEVEQVEQQVREMFEKLCDDADEGMTHEDMEKLLAVWGLPYKEAKYVFAELRPKLSDPNIISFDEFYKFLEPVWRYTLDVVTDQNETVFQGAVTDTMSFKDR